MNKMNMGAFQTGTPAADGYRFPAEWEPHEATWLTYPHSDGSFPGKLESIYPSYMQFIAAIAQSEKVRINTPAPFKERLLAQLNEANIDTVKVEIFERNSNDVWCRDHGPAFVVNDKAGKRQKAIVNWEFNAWGGKYPYDEDNLIAGAIASDFGLPVYMPGIVMEGGAVEFNGKGTLITTAGCLLNPNRNPGLNRQQIEQYLYDYYGVSQILWLREGIEGDDTDGHVDDITRFANPNTIITAVETDKNDVNYQPLHENLRILQKIRLLDGRQPDIVELPMPTPVIFNGQRLPASYANFYITNAAVTVPTFKCPNDETALQILAECFPDRKIIAIDATDIIWGLGSFHCLSQQEPA
jgi:agmatine deiminase